MCQKRTSLRLLLLPVLLVLLPSSVWAATLGSEFSLSLAGNTLHLDTAAAGLDGLLGIEPNDDYPWLWFGTRWSSYSEETTSVIGYRTQRRIAVAASNETVEAMQILFNPYRPLPVEPLPVGMLFEQLDYTALDFAVPLRKGPWELQLKGSAIFNAQAQIFAAAGRAFKGDDGVFHFLVQTDQLKGTNGAGWSLGGRLAYESERHKLSLDATDVIGSVYWSRALVRNGVINTNNKTVAADGTRSVAPYIQGVRSIERRRVDPVSSIRLRYQPKAAQWLRSIDVDVADQTLITASATVAAVPYANVTVGIVYPVSAGVIGVNVGNFRLAVTSDSLNPRTARTLGVQIAAESVF